MKAIANEEHITVEKTQLMILLPELMKHSKQSDNVNEMFETVLNIAFRTMEAGQSQVFFSNLYAKKFLLRSYCCHALQRWLALLRTRPQS